MTDWAPADLTRRGLLRAGSGAAIALSTPAPALTPSARPIELWYDRPAREWTEALPVGNGRLGAMVFGGIAREQLQLNEDTLWSGGPYDPVNPRAKTAMSKLREMIFARRYAEANDFASANIMAQPLQQAAYQPVGDLMIEQFGIDEASIRGYRRSLDLDAAVAETRFTANGATFGRRVLASPVDQVVAVRLETDRSGRIGARLSFACPLAKWAVATEGDDVLVLSGRNDAHGAIPGALRFEARLHVIAEGGRVRAADGAIMVEGADAATLLIAIATSHRGFDDVSGDPTALTRERIAKASARAFGVIADAAVEAHRRLFRRMTIDLGGPPSVLPTDARVAAMRTGDDPALAALYFQYARYLLIASSRPGSQPANLQGIWNDQVKPPWGSKYTININTEMNYWPAEATALPECVEPLVAMIEEMAVTGARTARTMYGARGWVAHHNTDLWRATAPIDGPLWGLWPTGGAWLSLHLWDRWDYGRDRAFLARVWPVLHGAALFFVDTLQTDPESGFLVTNPSLSPENLHGHGSSLIHGPTMDMQILRDLFDVVGKAAKILDREDETTEAMAAARARLLPMKIGHQGQLQEWPYDWDAGAPEQDHRHVSHLYGLYPSHQIDPDTTPALAAAARRSLELRGDEATGWATAWRINLWARLRDGERAHRILRFLLGPERTYPNLFDAHPPFQIDGNFGGAAGIVEMLVQDRGDTLLLLPALPRAWPTGSITGIRLRGRATLDLAWAGGRLEAARLRGDQAGERMLRLGKRSKRVRLIPGREVKVTSRDFA